MFESIAIGCLLTLETVAVLLGYARIAGGLK
jgi:hypothetical protein